MERKTIGSVLEFAKAMGISRNAVYVAVRRNIVHAVKIGKRILIPSTEIESTSFPKPEKRKSRGQHEEPPIFLLVSRRRGN